MNVNEILDVMDDMLDDAWSVPFSGGKCVIDVERLREMMSDVRLNLPSELKQAKLIVTDRKVILQDAQKEAERIIRTAEERARRMVDEHVLIKQAKEQAQEIVTGAQTHARELKRAASEFSEQLLQSTEQGLMQSLNQIKATRKALRSQNGLK